MLVVQDHFNLLFDFKTYEMTQIDKDNTDFDEKMYANILFIGELYLRKLLPI